VAFHGSSSSGSHGTLTVTIKASPSTNVHCSHDVSMAFPSTLAAFIGSIISGIAMFASGAFLAGMSWINQLDLHPESGSLVDDELCELVERPAILGAVVFSGSSPTTCACRALSDSLKGFDSDRCYPKALGIVHDLARDLMVDILHPAAFLVLGPLDRFLLVEALQLLPAGVELPALVPHLSTIAVEPSARSLDIGDGWDFDACVHSHDHLTLGLIHIWQGGSCIGDPFLAFSLDAQDALFANWYFSTTGDLDLFGLGPIPQRDDERSLESPMFVRSRLAHRELPILVIPLGKGLLENGEWGYDQAQRSGCRQTQRHGSPDS
jgi:hypothetical protein